MFGIISIINESRVFLITFLYYLLIILLCPLHSYPLRGLARSYSLFVKGLFVYHFQKPPRQELPRLVREDQVHQIYELKL